MYDFSKIKNVHLEVTGKCNAACPMCSRYTRDGFLQDFPQTHLSKEHFYKFFSEEFCEQLNNVYLSGVYGDPCMHPDLVEFVSYLKEKVGSCSVDSNAGYRTTKFWANLAKTGVSTEFAVDGLADTNHLYRRKVQWNKVEENMKAYSDAGGTGRWNFIVFEHNQHQLEEAKEFANRLGFDFRVKITQKFQKSMNWIVHEEGTALYELKTPQGEYRHPVIGERKFTIEQADYEKVIERSDDWSDGIEIECESLLKQEIFFNYEGYVLPCCHLGTLYEPVGRKDMELKLKLEKFKIDNYDLRTIVDNMDSIANTWPAKNCRSGKLLACASICKKSSKAVTKYANG